MTDKGVCKIDYLFGYTSGLHNLTGQHEEGNCHKGKAVVLGIHLGGQYKSGGLACENQPRHSGNAHGHMNGTAQKQKQEKNSKYQYQHHLSVPSFHPLVRCTRIFSAITKTTNTLETIIELYINVSGIRTPEVSLPVTELASTKA